MKRIAAIVMSVLMLLSANLPAFSMAGEKLLNTNAMTVGESKSRTVYKGDYIIVSNPSTSSSNSKSTGTVTGVQANVNANLEYLNDEPDYYPVDWVGSISKADEEELHRELDLIEKYPKKAVSYSVGSIKQWMICSDLSTNATIWVDFRCIGVGEHCYVWTANTSQYYPLDEIDSSYANSVINEFESNYSKMQNAFGRHTDVDGSGKVHLLYYDLQDGWSGSGGYVAGYFWSYDMRSTTNNAAILHIDTYPGVTNRGITGSYSTLFHEYQHLINYSRTKGMATWLNEAMSMAAEEYIYPNSAVPSRMGTWNAGMTYPRYHQGLSQLQWDGTLGAYAINCLFGQYLRAQTGGYAVFSDIINYAASGQTAANAITKALEGSPLEGMTIREIFLAFRIAMTVKASSGIYGFNGESAFNNARINYVSSTMPVYGCGAVIYKTVDGTYTVPDDATDGLVYVGVTQSGEVIPDPTQVTLNYSDYSGVKGESVQLTAQVLPSNAQDHIAWTSTDDNIASVDENGLVSFNSAGNVTIKATSVRGIINAVCSISISEERTYTASFDCGTNGFGAAIPDITLPFGAQFELPHCTVDMAGHEFSGWLSNYDNVIYHAGETVTMPERNVIFIAQWTQTEYTLTYDLNGGNAEIATASYHMGDEVTVSGIIPEKTGYEFTGWLNSSDNNIYVANSTFIMPSSNVVLTAQWTQTEYTLAYDLNGGNAEIATASYHMGDEVTVSDVIPEKTGYEFTGWLNSSDNNIYVANNTFIMPSSNVVLTAQYNEVHVIEPVLSVDVDRVYVSENAEYVSRFAYAYGRHTTLEQMREAGLRMASKAKSFIADRSGEYTVYIIMNDGATFFLYATVQLPPRPTAAFDGAKVFVNENADIVKRFAYSYGSYNNLAQMQAAGLNLASVEKSFMPCYNGVYTVYMKCNDGMAYIVKVNVSGIKVPTIATMGRYVYADAFKEDVERFAYASGEHNTLDSMKKSGLRMNSKGKDFIAPSDGVYTVFLAMKDGRKYFITVDARAVEPTLAINGRTVYADEYADYIVKFAYAYGEHNSLASMRTAGMRMNSAGKRFTASRSGVYTVYVVMKDGTAYFIKVNVVI